MRADPGSNVALTVPRADHAKIVELFGQILGFHCEKSGEDSVKIAFGHVTIWLDAADIDHPTFSFEINVNDPAIFASTVQSQAYRFSSVNWGDENGYWLETDFFPRILVSHHWK
ncbi:hypothetical protein [Sinorhizobium meliloti]|uniref:hypothetical protein n=1 Tax=Rhizobium meliloti TaxID=382 RepID=UPI0012948D59|nr:hypothetical protein [Sinorhizobium meliloti]MDE3858107.1 hypothetical protein [Sinorhizobium meliloti]MQW53409.1 hypothetical protein [Sinorhizobium meliloti]